MWSRLHAFEVGKDPSVLTVDTGGLRHGITPERVTCLAAVWASRTWLGAQRLPAAAVRVCSEAVRERGRGPLRIVAQIVPELRAWLRDAFGLRGEALTSALTMSTLFEAAPRVVGGAWSGGEGGGEVDEVAADRWGALRCHSTRRCVGTHNAPDRRRCGKRSNSATSTS